MANKIPEIIRIPENIIKWVEEHNGVNLAINYNTANADVGYVHMIWHTVCIYMITRHCARCGYDVIWNPSVEKPCPRHTYSAWNYDIVFKWSDFQNPVGLAEAFDDWLLVNSDDTKPVQYLSFGQDSWR